MFLLRPKDRRSWDALLAVSFPVHFDGEDPKAERDFGATIRRGSRIVQAFNRRITLRAAAGKTSRRQVTFLEPLEVGPGGYEVRAVVSDPRGERPSSALARFEVPSVPRKRAFLVGPILGSRAGMDVVVRADEPSQQKPRKPRPKEDRAPRDRVGTGASFEPLLVQEVARGEPVFALTQACGVLSPKDSSSGKVVRSLSSESGRSVGTLDPVSIDLDGSDEVSCRNLLDLIPTAVLEPGRYELSAVLEVGEPREQDAERAAARFLLLPAGEGEGESRGKEGTGRVLTDDEPALDASTPSAGRGEKTGVEIRAIPPPIFTEWYQPFADACARKGPAFALCSTVGTCLGSPRKATCWRGPAKPRALSPPPAPARPAGSG